MNADELARSSFNPRFRPRELGQLALGSPDLVPEIHRVLTADYERWAGARPPGVDQAAHAAPDMPVRELSRVGPPVWNFFA